MAVTMTSGGFNGKNNIIVSVADNGVGINDADKVNLFKFFRSPEAHFDVSQWFWSRFIYRS